MSNTLWLLTLFFFDHVNCQNRKNDTDSKGLLTEAEKKTLMKVLPPVALSLLSFIGTTITAYFLYKNTSAVAKNLMDASAKAYNITVGSCKNAYCWSVNVFCSSMTCCCSQRGWFWCCKGEGNGERTPLVELRPLVYTNNHTPITNFLSYYRKILENSNKVDFHEFLRLHQLYSDTPSQMSHVIHCQNPICIRKKHADYEKWSGVSLEPFIYYLVLDWSYLRCHIFEPTATEKDLFRLLFRNERPYNDQLDTEWEDLTRKLKNNVFVTLLNFPEIEEFGDDPMPDNSFFLLFLVVDFYKLLEIRVANVVKSSWNVPRDQRILEYGASNCDLTILTSLKTYPAGRDLTIGWNPKEEFLKRVQIINCDEDAHEHLINEWQQDKFFDISFNVDVDGRTKIQLKNIPIGLRRLVCRIYLGDMVRDYKDRIWYTEPYLESPVIHIKPKPKPKPKRLSTGTTSTFDFFVETDGFHASNRLTDILKILLPTLFCVLCFAVIATGAYFLYKYMVLIADEMNYSRASHNNTYTRTYKAYNTTK